MSVFAELQAELASELQRHGIRRAHWDWDAAGWSAADRNGGERWTCRAGKFTSEPSSNGEAALRRLITALKDG